MPNNLVNGQRKPLEKLTSRDCIIFGYNGLKNLYLLYYLGTFTTISMKSDVFCYSLIRYF